MNLSYKARYYNGRLSKPFLVDISIDAKGIDIAYTDEHQQYQSTRWNGSQIVESDFSSSLVVLRYGAQFPYEQLEVTDHDFIAAYREHFKKQGIHNWLHFSSIGMVGVLAIGFVVSIALGYFFVLPIAADHIANNIPKDYEIEMGAKIYTNILSESTVDTSKTAAINHFFTQLKTDNSYPVHITVLKDSVVNAYALPGGGIIVYDAILNTMHTPEELAALLSHEYSHITLKHTTRNIIRSIAGYLFISVIFSDANSIANLIIDNANNLRNLSYSRELEHEADQNGLFILKENHLTSKGMITLFESLQKNNQVEVDEIISTHPDLENRISFVKQFASENPYQPETNDSLTFYFNRLQNN
jgi:beta-barrel assembly-enhancing protease